MGGKKERKHRDKREWKDHQLNYDYVCVTD